MSGNEQEISRVTRSKKEAQATYDSISAWYDVLEGIWEKRSKEAGLQKLNVKEGEFVLEIGPGTGHGIVSLARSAGVSGMVFGIDISRRMIDITQKRADQMGLSGNVSLIWGDAVYLPFPSGSFNAIFMSFALELMDNPDIPIILNECRRVLQGGGRICVVSLSRTGGTSLIRDLYEWGHRNFPRLLDCRPIFVRKALEDAG